MSDTKNSRMPALTAFLMAFGFTVFIVMTILVSITPVFMQVARMTACPGAADYMLSYQDGGTIRRAGSPYETGSSTVGLTCTFADDSKKEAGNDSVFGYGFLGSAIIALLAGLVTGGWNVWRGRAGRG